MSLHISIATCMHFLMERYISFMMMAVASWWSLLQGSLEVTESHHGNGIAQIFDCLDCDTKDLEMADNGLTRPEVPEMLDDE